MRFWAQKVAYWRTVDRAKIPYERKYSVQFGNVLNHALEVIVRRVESGQSLADAADNRAIANLISLPFAELYSDLYIEVGRDFGRAALRAVLLGKSGQELFAVKAPDEWDVWDPLRSQEFSDWATRVTASRITGISNQVKVDIRDLVDRAHIDGMDTAKVVNRLRSLYGFSKERAQRIAQTEINSAQNAASHFAIGKHVDNDIVEKTWLAVGDRRMRKSHERANGQVRKYEEAFEVGGAELNFPGDTSLGAPGKEIIRCRCVATYAVVRTGGGRVQPKPQPKPLPDNTPVAKPVRKPRKPKRPTTGSTTTVADALNQLYAPGSDTALSLPLTGAHSAEEQMLQDRLSRYFANSPDLLKRALNNGTVKLRGIEFAGRSQASACYEPLGSRVVVFPDSAPYSQDYMRFVYRHEYGHHFDYRQRFTGSSKTWMQVPRADGGLKDALSEARAKLSKIKRERPEVFAELKRLYGYQTNQGWVATDSNRKAFIDILGTISKGEVGFGHTMEYYTTWDNVAQSEVAANLISLTSGGPTGRAMLKELGDLFPSLITDFVAGLTKAAAFVP